MFAIVIAATLLLIGAYTIRALFRTPNLGLYYAPTIYSEPRYFSISIPVEIEKKGDKISFIELFNVYGFSGNGPSIEQVVKANINSEKLEYDSEGDTFVVYAPDHDSYILLLKELEAVKQIELLNGWLRKAAWVPIKE